MISEPVLLPLEVPSNVVAVVCLTTVALPKPPHLMELTVPALLPLHPRILPITRLLANNPAIEIGRNSKHRPKLTRKKIKHFLNEFF